MRDCTIVAVGNSADVALTIAQEEPGLISAVVLINPTLREYLDPRLPSYLGALIEAERNRSLQTVTQAGSPPKAADLAERLVPTTADDEHRTLLRNQVEDILTSAFEHARQPQQHVPLLVLERLHKLHNIPIRLITVGEGSTADGAEKVIVEALKHALANADHVHVRSSWGNLLPLGEPIPVAKLIEEVAVKTTSKP